MNLVWIIRETSKNCDEQCSPVNDDRRIIDRHTLFWNSVYAFVVLHEYREWEINTCFMRASGFREIVLSVLWHDHGFGCGLKIPTTEPKNLTQKTRPAESVTFSIRCPINALPAWLTLCLFDPIVRLRNVTFFFRNARNQASTWKFDGTRVSKTYLHRAY